MKILLGQTLVYIPARGGANKANRLLLEGLSQLGHECHAVTRACGAQGFSSPAEFASDLSAKGYRLLHSSAEVSVFDCNAVKVHAVLDPSRLSAYFGDCCNKMRPDWILISTEDPAWRLLRTAVSSRAGRIAYLAHTPLALPCGPEALSQSAQATALLGEVDAILCETHFLKGYFRTYAGLHAEVMPISPFDPGPYPILGGIDQPYVTMINPCAVKGLSIFLAIAEAMPDIRFAVVPSWGTTGDNITALKRLDNVTIRAGSDNIRDVLAGTSVLLVPSLWQDNRPRVITEAMLHGIPVIASDVGGVREAKRGIDFILPVEPILRYTNQLDDRMMPVPEIPAQNIAPWIEALRACLRSRSAYDDLAQSSRTAALGLVASESVTTVDSFLRSLHAAL
jgi:glycosyltransferase involved in cell wall biosynthesis